MSIKMELRVKFNREVVTKKDYICPSRYEMVMNGRNVQFDFCTSSYRVDKYDSTVCIFSLEEPDFNEFPDFKKVTVNDLQNISSIKECFVYTGEDGESDLKVVSIKKITFSILTSKFYVIDVPKKLIDKYNKMLSVGKKLEQKNGLSLKELKDEIMLQKLTFCSRFLDVPLEDLCGYSKEQLESMIDSTLEQMPGEILRQFEIDLAYGKREF